MNILITAKNLASTNVLNPVVGELVERGHSIVIHATGNDAEATGFKSSLPVNRYQPQVGEYDKLLRSQDLLLTGLSGHQTHDAHFIRAANTIGIPSIAVNDQNVGYTLRLDDKLETLPTYLGMMHDDCAKTLETELADPKYDVVRREALNRIKVVGWTAYDNFAQLRAQSTPETTAALKQQLGLNPHQKVHTFFTQNIHPDTEYLKPHIAVNGSAYRALREEMFDYELDVTDSLFTIAKELGIHLVVKPHPGEAFSTNFTEDFTKKNGFTYLPAKACDSKQLILASDAIFATRSGTLNDSCLLDRNTAAIVPVNTEIDKDIYDASIYPAVSLDAIPYANRWEDIKSIVWMLTADNSEHQAGFKERRTRFSVDGKASKRLADLVETFK